MSAALLTLFVSLVLATLGVALFVWAVKRGEPDHLERLALLPLDDDAGQTPAPNHDDQKEEPDSCDR